MARKKLNENGEVMEPTFVEYKILVEIGPFKPDSVVYVRYGDEFFSYYEKGKSKYVELSDSKKFKKLRLIYD